jgi:hypothetical protein
MFLKVIILVLMIIPMDAQQLTPFHQGLKNGMESGWREAEIQNEFRRNMTSNQVDKYNRLMDLFCKLKPIMDPWVDGVKERIRLQNMRERYRNTNMDITTAILGAVGQSEAVKVIMRKIGAKDSEYSSRYDE